MKSIADIIDLIMVYPKYKPVKDDIDNCYNKFNYQCNLVECDFTKCIKEIEENRNLNSIEKKATIKIVNTLDKNQERFVVKNIGGFILEHNAKYYTNFPVVLLNESTLDEINEKRFGFCNITNWILRLTR